VGNAQPRPLTWVTTKSVGEYVIKLFIAIGLTPAVYAVHELVVRRLGIDPVPHPVERRLSSRSASEETG
jgi:hypothetical protein